MAIGKGNNAAAIMGTVGKIEKRLLAHVNPEIGPTNAVGIDVLKEKHARGHRRDDLAVFPEDFVLG